MPLNRKLTARKMTGPRGVPRHQLTERTVEVGEGSRPPRKTRKDLKKEIEYLTKERDDWIQAYGIARSNHYADVRQNKGLRKELEGVVEEKEQMVEDFTTARTEHYRDVRKIRRLRQELAQLTRERDEAQERENERLHQIAGLQERVHALEAYSDTLHEEVHVLWDQLYPDPGAAESSAGEIFEEGQDETPAEE